MTVRRMRRLVAGWALVTVIAHLLGLGDVGGLLSFILLGGLIGAPLALHLGRNLRSTTATITVSLALSFSLTAVAVQSLVWFHQAQRVLIILLATAYGLGLASLLDDPDEIGAGIDPGPVDLDPSPVRRP